MKVLVDENIDGWDIRLQARGFDAFSVKKLIINGERLTSDFSVLNYARNNDMVLITKDKECIRGCVENYIKCVGLDDESMFELATGALVKLQNEDDLSVRADDGGRS